MLLFFAWKGQYSIRRINCHQANNIYKESFVKLSIQSHAKISNLMWYGDLTLTRMRYNDVPGTIIIPGTNCQYPNYRYKDIHQYLKNHKVTNTQYLLPSTNHNLITTFTGNIENTQNMFTWTCMYVWFLYSQVEHSCCSRFVHTYNNMIKPKSK